jgi:hypothetical protein
MDDEELHDIVMQRLTTLTLPGRPTLAPTRIYRSKWRCDQFSRGSYSYNAVGHRRGQKVDPLLLSTLSVHVIARNAY